MAEKKQEAQLVVLSPTMKGQLLSLSDAVLSIDDDGNVTIVKANNVFLEDVNYMCMAPLRSGDCLEAKPVKEKVEPGDEMPDGTIFVGLNPKTSQGIYMMPKRFDSKYYRDESISFISSLEAYGHKDWRLPTRREMDIIRQQTSHESIAAVFNNRSPGPWFWVKINDNTAGGYDLRDCEFRRQVSQSSEAAVSAVRTGPAPIGFL